MLREYPQEETEAMYYGNLYHEAAELYVRGDAPLPKKFDFSKQLLDKLNALEGDKLCEFKMGVTKDLKPCAFDAEDVWFRGISDLSVTNEPKQKAHVFDYKTGKSAKYADPGQLELMTLATFAHFPTINKVKAALLFVVSGEIVKAQYSREDEATLWKKWLTKYAAFASAHKKNIWNPNPSGLCRKHCPVQSCPHYGGGR